MNQLRSKTKGEYVEGSAMMRIRYRKECAARLLPSASLVLGGLALYALGGVTFVAADQPSFVQDGKAGFVVADIQYALARDAEETGACPDGMTQGMQGAFAFGGAGPGVAGAGQRPAGVSTGGQGAGAVPSGGGQVAGGPSEEEAQRLFFQKLTDPSRPNPCTSPEAFGPDPNFRTVKIPDTKAYGIDLDGRDSRAKGKPAPGTCAAHNDLVGMNGEHGIDNQFYRVVGCSKSYQSTGLSNVFTTEMLTGAWGILIALNGVDDIRNDASVEVGVYANADPIELSPNREPLPNATYAFDQDPRFRTKTRGRIVDGVLTTEPVDMRFHKVTNGIYLERPLRDARFKLTLSKEGNLEGYLAGYTPVEELYDFQYAYRNGKNGKGEPADRRLILISSLGQAGVLGHTCNGAYYALHELADGHPDPQTGKCTSISTQYRIKAIPAFVVDVKTQSINEDLER